MEPQNPQNQQGGQDDLPILVLHRTSNLNPEGGLCDVPGCGNNFPPNRDCKKCDDCVKKEFLVNTSCPWCSGRR